MRFISSPMLMTCLLTFSAMLVQGCAFDHPATPKTAAPQRMINDIMTIQTADSLTVEIQADQPLTYTVMPQDSPQTLVIQFANTGFDRLGSFFFPPENMAVHSIRTLQTPENGIAAQVVLGLKGNIPYRLVPEGNRLKVVFTKTTAPAPIAASRQAPPAAKQRPPSPPSSGILKEVAIAARNGGVAVHMHVDGRVKDYKTFTIDTPPPAKIVLDLVGLRSAFRDEQKIPVEGAIVTRVRHFGHPDRVRVVIETEKAYLRNFSVESVGDGMVLIVNASTGKEN